MDELTKAIKQINSGLASGKDGIPAEIYKATGPRAMEVFLDIIQSIWDQEKMPEDFRDALIVALYKNKGSKVDCGNYRGISLLSIAGKIFARIILNRLIAVSEANLPEAQCGFRPGRSNLDMIFTVRQVQEKCLEQNLDLYSVFIDLTKAFDTVNREALWDVLARHGCPPKFIQIILLFHVNMTGQVLSNGEQSDPFTISNGVKQGCVLAPVLLNLFFICVLRQAVGNMDEGVYVCFRYDGSIFDLRRLSAKTKTLNNLIQEALFADDCALMAHKPGHLQAMLNSFSDASKQFGLTISLGKTEVLFQRAPNSVVPQPAISIDDVELKVVDSFKYLGSMISSYGSLDKEIASRISKVSQALGRLHNRLLNHHNVTLAQTYTNCVICTRGRASPPSTVRKRTPPLSSIYPSDSCKLPVPSLCTGLQVQDRPAEPLPYPQIEAQCHPADRGTTKMMMMIKRKTEVLVISLRGPVWIKSGTSKSGVYSSMNSYTSGMLSSYIYVGISLTYVHITFVFKAVLPICQMLSAQAMCVFFAE